jgi:hypothetical protein
MSKQQIILSDTDRTSFEQPWLEDTLSKYFDIVFLEHNPTIDPNSIVVTNLFNTNKWYSNLVDNGCKLIVDNLWEVPNSTKFDALYLTNKNWFWYNESLWYRHLGYHNHISAPNVSKNGLLLMNIRKNHRDWLFDQVNIDKLLHSYVGKGVLISDDIDASDPNWQRYFNPNWYNTTAFSLVAETTPWHDDPLFITEKTFKPIAFQHPFIVFGQPGILTYLKAQGFETFENIFDERYDNIQEIDTRLNNIAEQVNNYSHKNYDLLTLSKLKHNKELFFDKQLVRNRIIKEIIEPILEYAET